MELKNNLKYIAILSISFFYSSYIYLNQSTRIREVASTDHAGLVAVVFGSFSMAVGIFLFTIICKKTNVATIRKLYLLFVIISFVSYVFSAFNNNPVFVAVCLCLSSAFATGGFGVGYLFSITALNVKAKYLGRVFTIGYAIGSALVFFASRINIESDFGLLSIIITAVAFFFSVVLAYNSFGSVNDETYAYENGLSVTNIKKYFFFLSILVLFAATLTALTQDFVGYYSLEQTKTWFGDSRIYYSIGLILAGLIYDIKKEIFYICLPVSFIGQLIALLLLNQSISIAVVSAVSYLFIGFFSLFRAAFFIEQGTLNKKLLYLVALGMMFERIVEGSVGLLERTILSNVFVVSIIAAALLIGFMWTYMFYFNKTVIGQKSQEKDMLKELSIEYGLSGQEEKVLGYLLKDYTKKEIADEMVLSVNTIKVHVTNIYKKTGLGKSELKAIYYKKD
ncbi:MAG: helix-turn-helix transcriptional regulator [Lachnospiraceae bacterium]|nr:helix-turn-helix transcriptional regulator [Lachnospiraceae bacterium]